MSKNVRYPSLRLLRNFFIQISAILLAWYLFGLLALYPSIDGLKWTSAMRISVFCSFCTFGLFFSTVKFASQYRLLKLLFLMPSLVIFSIMSYLLEPFLLILTILSLVSAFHNVISEGRLNEKPNHD
jgi:hypothetical protein